MKFKKLLISASAIAAGSGLLATVLTSCAKANIDEKLKIELNDEGKLYKPGKMDESKYSFTWQSVITNALTRSTNWAQFKNALADEIVYSWYLDRAAESKTSDKKNSTFRTNIDEWNYQINKDYDSVIQTCKNKYGANWEFYFQNEYLSPNGGTEASYKHYKLVDKVKAEFLSKVFSKNYFGFSTYAGTDPILYPHTYTPATKNVGDNTLDNPANWDKLGFFARADSSFPFSSDIPTSYDKVDSDWLAKHPEGDYAAIQSKVFDEWFKSEKPFFSDAALFKYSMPTRVASGKLDQLFNATYTGVKLPDKPNESFPFFGAGDDGSTRKAVDFLTQLGNNKFATKYTLADKTTVYSNGTVTIDKAVTDDSQTILLVPGNQMFSNLYTPYAMASGSLYDQMLSTDASATTKAPNILTAKQVQDNINAWSEGVVDDFAILSNFFYQTDPTLGTNPTIKHVLDLQQVFGGELTGDGKTADTAFEYHCPLFCKCESYPYFYGDTNSTAAAFQDAAGNYWSSKTGIKFITNNIQVNDFTYSSVSTDAGQPWVMELNESGVHFQTIDGFNYIRGTTPATESTDAKLARAKKVVMYRLMQKQLDNAAGKCISSDLFGESGKLKTYFTDNFANIVLELAQSSDKEYQVFRKISSYTTTETIKQDDLFLNDVYKNQKLGKDDSYGANFLDYINKIIDYDKTKKIFTNLDTVNTKIYSYRSKQITNTKSSEKFSKTVFENGLLAPFVYEPTNNENISTRDYACVNRIVVQDMPSTVTLTDGYITTMDKLQKDITALATSGYVKDVLDNASALNGDRGFCPQITAAKAKTSNRFWYNSTIVDKTIHSFMGSKAATANQIKMNAYNYYISTKDTDNWFSKKFAADPAAHAWTTTYKRSKLLSGDKNISNYVGSVGDIDTLSEFYSVMNSQFTNYLSREKINNGETSDEMLSETLFRATLLYLVGDDLHTKDPVDFQNFYTLLDTKVSENEGAIVGYLTKDYSYGTRLNDEMQVVTAANPTVYDYDANVDNYFDKFGYDGTESSTKDKEDSKLSVSSYWTAITKTFGNGVSKDMNGFLGLQTKASNQLDSGSGMQGAVFDEFASATKNSYNLDETTATTYEQNRGCWFKFAGSKDSKDLTKLLTFDTFTGDDETELKECSADWFGTTAEDEYAVVRKIAKRIAECSTPDDLRTIASELAKSYEGYSYFKEFADGRVSYKTLNDLKLKMMKVLPSKKAAEAKALGKTTAWGFDHADDICTFKRVKNAEAHTVEQNPSYKFTDSKAKTSYRLMLTQINKADVVEHNLHPTWDGTKWVMPSTSPITNEEFWVILFNLASESTIQQRVVTEIVKNAFGDDKLIVYDAQLYNQFDSVWIKDWTKKTMGA